MPKNLVPRLLLFLGLLVPSPLLSSDQGAQPADPPLTALVRELSPANAPVRVTQLARLIREGRISVDQLAERYFRGSEPTPKQRQRWIHNMQINFRIINHQSRYYTPQKELMARRAVELTLFRIAGRPHPRHPASPP